MCGAPKRGVHLVILHGATSSEQLHGCVAINQIKFNIVQLDVTLSDHREDDERKRRISRAAYTTLNHQLRRREAIHRHAHLRQLHGGLIIVLGVPHREVAVLCFRVGEVLDPCHAAA